MLRDNKYEAVIGLEIHAQLNTASKAFCADQVSYGDTANSLISPVSIGHPGTLPVHNKKSCRNGHYPWFGLWIGNKEVQYVFA